MLADHLSSQLGANEHPRVVTLLDHYLPGFKSGGPLRTVSNMVEQMGEAYDFRIITRDRDATDTKPYPNVSVDAWNHVGHAQVYYASPGHLSFGRLRSLIRSATPDVLYLNSFFSTLAIKCLFLRRFGVVPDIPVVLAPRGELSPGALSLKHIKKRLYMTIARWLGVYGDLLWQASSSLEQDEISAVFSRARVHVAPNVPAGLRMRDTEAKPKSSGVARFIFLSRISPKKNLHRVLKMLRGLSGEISLSIVGPIRDEGYWEKCAHTIRRLPENVHVDVLGSVPHEQVHDLLSRHHFLVLPTLGENFGHAILEALAAGVPVLISDQTPWRGLAHEGVGWDMALDDTEGWLNVLQYCVDIHQDEYDRISSSARTYAVHWSSDNSILRANTDLFTRACST